MNPTTDISPLDLLRSCEVVRVRRDDAPQKVDIEVPFEHGVDVFVDDQLAMVLTCTPSNIEELVIGRLFTEGLIGGIEAIDSLSLDNYQKSAHVFLRKHREFSSTQGIQHVDTCGAGTQTLLRGQSLSKMKSPLNKKKIDPDQVFCMARVFAKDTPLHSSTLGVHSCSLFRGFEQLYSFEDLGRHNAFDKAIGAALIDGVEMSELAVLSSGRIPVDMITKAIRSGIPLLVTKATPTTRSVGIARAHGLSLVGRARPDSFCIFSE